MVDSFINDHDKDKIDAFRNMTLDRKKTVTKKDNSDLPRWIIQINNEHYIWIVLFYRSLTNIEWCAVHVYVVIRLSESV